MANVAGALTPNPPVNTGDGPDVIRPQPTDPPGSRDGSGWVKTDADGPGGWRAIDDVGDDGTPVWRQC